MQTLFTQLKAWFGNGNFAADLAHFAIGAGIVAGCALLLFLVYWASQRLLLVLINRLTAEKHRLAFLRFEMKKATKYLALLIPAALFSQFINVFFATMPSLQGIIANAINVYILFITCLLLALAVDVGVKALRLRSEMRNVALKSYSQVVKILLYLVFGIAILALIINQNPWKFISGLGALTALIMLVFKDTILGFIASIQLSANQLVHEGDWVTMPKYGADGDVIEINLTTVKVRNFDMTITSIPTYAFISDSFINWRGMSESGGRRIKRALNIDMNTVRFCSKELLERLKNVTLLANYFKERENRLALTIQPYTHSSERLNHPQITNLGAFRHYVQAYLANHDMVNKTMTLIVRQLDPTPNGLPIELYLFSKDKRWSEYETIQSDIFDHLISCLPIFDLAVFQSPTGRDFQTLNQPHAFSSNPITPPSE